MLWRHAHSYCCQGRVTSPWHYEHRTTSTRNSAKLTNQHVSCACTCSPFSFHVHYILPTSNFEHSYSGILLIFYRHQWTTCVRTVSVMVWIQFTGLTFPLRVTPMNNPITLVSSVQSLGYIFCRWQYMRSSANFCTVFSESQNANPLDAERETYFNANDHWRSFKVTCSGANEELLRGYLVQYHNCGLECEGPEDRASERSENRHLQWPHSHLTPPSSEPTRISTQILPC